LDKKHTLTKAQVDELRFLSREKRPTYGASRARVQNNLYYGLRYVRFIDFEGKEVHPHEMGIKAPDVEWCEITDAGRQALTDYDSAKKARRSKK
jgi:hypothetical protein